MTYIFLEKGIICFFWKVAFNLGKMYTKKYIYLKCNGKMGREGFHQKGKKLSAGSIFMVYFREAV